MKRRKIHLLEVESRAVSAIGYHETRRELYILFRGKQGGLYVYSEVSPSEWHMLQHTSTIGGIVNAHIKTRHSGRQLGPNEVDIVIQRESPATHG
jgi:hypothetical protein